MPNPATEPEDIVIAKLTGQLGLVAGTNLFSMPPRPQSSVVARNAVFCFSNFSFLPSTYLGINKDYRQFLVQIVIRYGVDDFRLGKELGRNIWALLQRASLSGYTGYVSCTLRESEPLYLGPDDNDNHRWLLTVNLQYVG